jgi:hypothetical protein
MTVAGGDGAGSAANQFDGALGVSVDSSGDVYVADPGNNRVQEWEAGPNGAPLFTVDPQSQTVTGSGNVTFTAGAIGRPPLTVRWQQSTDGGSTWSDIAGATSFTYSITTVPLSDNGFEFRAVFTNAAGSATTDAATLTVTTATAPTITTQPTSQTISGTGTVTFPAAASGSPSPTVQWQRSTDAGSTWSDIAGATSDTYTFTNSPFDNGFEFRAVFTNAAGSATTSSATLTVNPSITPTGTVAGGNGGGSAANQLNAPVGVFVDSSGDVYVADWGNGRVQEWAPGATAGVTVAGGNGSGSASNQLSTPSGVFVDSSGDVYVTDQGNDRVQEWAPGATAGMTVAGGNGAGSAANQLNQPAGVFVNGAGDVYVADTQNERVQKWAPGATAGVTVSGGNGAGSAANQLNVSIFSGVSVDGVGNIYVADTFNDQVQRWAPGATSGTTVAGGNGTGMLSNQLGLPEGLFVDSSGDVSVADTNNGRVQQWAPGATAGVTVAGDNNGTGSAASQLDSPSGVFVDSAGIMYVADTNNNRVQAWGALPNVAPFTLDSPQSQTVFGTGNVSFTAAAGGRPQPTVQWQQSTDGGSTWSNIAGATSNTYGITAVPVSDNGDEFRAVFTNVAGSVTTNTATLTVNPPIAPAITTQPTSQSVLFNTSVSFSAAASGGPAPTVRWQQSTDGGSTWSDITGATSTTYSISLVSVPQNGWEFRAVFTNSVGSATTNPATLTVTAPPPTTSVLLPSSGATVSGGAWLDAGASSEAGIASVHFEVSAGSITHMVISSGYPTLYGYIGGWDATDVPNGTYTLQSVATDALGQSTTSAGITVSVDNLPLTTEVLVPSNGATLSGSAAVLDAAATGTSDVTSVQFVVSGGTLSNDVVGTATLTLNGWIAEWNTTAVPNGTYTLESVATEVGGTTATSSGVTVMVQN